MKKPVPTRRGRPLKDQRKSINIAATTDYRGADEDQLCFVFRGVTQQLMEHVFRYLVGEGHGIAQQFIISEEHDVVRRSGKGYWRIAVEVVKPNFQFCSLDDMKILIEAICHRLHPCSFSWMPINKFLNV